jgi:hypothetical protein
LPLPKVPLKKVGHVVHGQIEQNGGQLRALPQTLGDWEERVQREKGVESTKHMNVGNLAAFLAAKWEWRAVAISVVDVCALKPPCVDEIALEGPRT